MEPLPRNNHVFVDCENLPQIDPTHIGAKTVKFHLLFGVNQKKLDMDIVEKISKHADGVELIRLTSAGRNALDFVLSYQIGRTSVVDPTAYFHIVSEDNDYEPLVKHLSKNSIKITHHKSFSTLPFSAQPKPPSSPAPSQPTTTPKNAAISPAKPKAIGKARLQSARKHLESAKPKTEKTLISSLANHLALQPSDPAVLKAIKSFEKENFLKIDAEKKVTYPSLPKPAPAAPTHA